MPAIESSARPWIERAPGSSTRSSPVQAPTPAFPPPALQDLLERANVSRSRRQMAVRGTRLARAPAAGLAVPCLAGSLYGPLFGYYQRRSDRMRPGRTLSFSSEYGACPVFRDRPNAVMRPATFGC